MILIGKYQRISRDQFCNIQASKGVPETECRLWEVKGIYVQLNSPTGQIPEVAIRHWTWLLQDEV